MAKILAKTFLSRHDLEEYIKYTFKDKKPTKTDVISGTYEEMRAFHLDSTTTVHGIPCEIAEFVNTKDWVGVIGNASIDRGEQQEFGINIKRKKNEK